MKLLKITALSFAIAISANSSTAIAAESAQITVKGAIFPSACSIVVDGAADFGNLKKNELQAQGNFHDSYQLGYKPVSFNIQCSSAVKVALSAQAETPPTGVSNVNVINYVSETESMFGSMPEQLASLGLLDGRDIGYFTVTLAHVDLDGENSRILTDNQSNGATWDDAAEVLGRVMYQDGSVLHSWGKDNIPQAASNITGVINISAAVDPKVVDGAKDAINFNTGTTLSLHYL